MFKKRMRLLGKIGETAVACFLVCFTLLAIQSRLSFADTLDVLYTQARKDYHAALALPEKDQSKALQRCIVQFLDVIQKDPGEKYTDRCLYLIAQCYHRLYDANPTDELLQSAKKYYRLLIQKYPKSPLADDGQYLIGFLYLDKDPSQAYLEFAKVGIFFPEGDMQSRASEKAQQLKKQLESRRQNISDTASKKAAPFAFASGTSDAPSLPTNSPKPSKRAANRSKLKELEKIQHWAGENYTRVVLYVSKPVVFERHNLPAEPKIGLPDRIYLDLKNCTVNPRIKQKISVRDRFLQRIRVAQYDATQVRVVLDVKSMENYKIFSLADPYRLIIDVRGKAAQAKKRIKTPLLKIDKDAETSTLARQLGLHVGRIVIDPGHGGKDKGAISPNGLYEKDVVLVIAERLKKILQSETGCEVILTRSDDRFLTLEERTAIANAKKADLFISIHTNAHENPRLRGTETYFLNLSKDKESARVAALENATSTKRISDMETILKDIMLNTKISESEQLARMVQRQLIKKLKRKYKNVKDLGVKQAPFYVLLGAEMPSILIETAFITNQTEEHWLKSKRFQKDLALGIAAGVNSYIKQMSQFARAKAVK